MANASKPSEPQPTTSKAKIPFLMVGGLAIGLLVGWFLLKLFQGGLFGPPRFNGIVIQSPQPLSDFTLTSHTGERVSLSDFRGKVVLLYFGYTYCPDVCPTTSSELAQAKRALGRDGDEVQVIMISVDPARDTPEVLAGYITHFDPSFIGLTGTDDEITAATIPLGIFYEKREGTVATGYAVDHTASIAAIDQNGYLRLIYPFGTPAGDIAADLRYLIRH